MSEPKTPAEQAEDNVREAEATSWAKLSGYLVALVGMVTIGVGAWMIDAGLGVMVTGLLVVAVGLNIAHFAEERQKRQAVEHLEGAMDEMGL